MEAINILSARLVRAAFAAFLLPLTISAGQFGPAYSRGKSYLEHYGLSIRNLQRLNVRPSEPKWELCFAKEECSEGRD